MKKKLNDRADVKRADHSYMNRQHNVTDWYLGGINIYTYIKNDLMDDGPYLDRTTLRLIKEID